MKPLFLLAFAVALALPVYGRADPIGNLSERAKIVFLTMMGEAQQRGAQTVDVNDLILALVIEDQDPDALLVFQAPPLGTVLSGPIRMPPRTPRQSFIPAGVATSVLVKLLFTLPRSAGLPHNTQMQILPALQRVLNAAQQLPSRFNQEQVRITSGTSNHPPGMYQAVVPLDLLAAALQEPCEGTKLLQEAGITEQTVIETIKRGGDLENWNPPETPK